MGWLQLGVIAVWILYDDMAIYDWLFAQTRGSKKSGQKGREKRVCLLLTSLAAFLGGIKAAGTERESSLASLKRETMAIKTVKNLLRMCIRLLRRAANLVVGLFESADTSTPSPPPPSAGTQDDPRGMSPRQIYDATQCYSKPLSFRQSLVLPATLRLKSEPCIPPEPPQPLLARHLQARSLLQALPYLTHPQPPAPAIGFRVVRRSAINK